MKSIYLLIGEKETKKSSTIRCLLGIDSAATNVEVQCISGMRIHIRGLISSPQEKTPISIQQLLDELNNQHWKGELASVRNLIVPLHWSARKEDRENYPAAKEYIESILEDGWTIKGIASLGQEAEDWLRKSGLPYISIPDSRKLPGSIVAKKVRKAFGWL